MTAGSLLASRVFNMNSRTVNCCSCDWTACCAASTVALQVSQLHASQGAKLVQGNSD